MSENAAIIDEEGYRSNVGIILAGPRDSVLLARRLGQDAWQFPQGGVHEGEADQDTLYRELKEELGLGEKDVKILGSTVDWLKYNLPEKYQRRHSKPLCIGQKQKWFLLKLIVSDQKIKLDATDSPEFDSWRWVNYWYPLKEVIAFKKQVYRDAMNELHPYLEGKAG